MITNATYTRTIPKEKYGTESLSVDIAKSADKTIEESIFEAVAFVNFQLKLTVKSPSPIPSPENQPFFPKETPKKQPFFPKETAPPASFSERVSDCLKMFGEIGKNYFDLEEFLKKRIKYWINEDLTKLSKYYIACKESQQPKKEA